PVTFDADPVRDEKTKVMRAIRPIAADDVDRVAVRGQYGPGFVGGQRVVGYREEKSVSAESITETFAALRLEVENWRWAGVPFYLRTGKRLPKRASEIAVQFRQTPHRVFGRTPEILAEPNRLVLRIQPDEGMSLSFGAKLPGPDLRIKPVEMEFDYGQAFGGEPPEAYERLLLDAMKGDATLYARGDWVMMAWDLLQPVLDAWHSGDRRKFPNYDAGTWGPSEADTLIERSGRRGGAPEGAAAVAPRLLLELRLRGADHPGRRHLDPGVVPALVDQHLQRAAGLLVDLRGALVGRGRRRQVLPAVGLERGPERDAQ